MIKRTKFENKVLNRKTLSYFFDSHKMKMLPKRNFFDFISKNETFIKIDGVKEKKSPVWINQKNNLFLTKIAFSK